MIPVARLFVGLMAIASFSGEIRAQAFTTQPSSAKSCTTFDVASIKPNTSGAGDGYPELAPGARRFTATNRLMLELIMYAYDVSPLQISGIPDAFFRERYDIDATCERPMMKEELPHLLQALLAERFHLSIHRESKEQRVYALITDKGGSRLHEASHEGDKAVLRQSGYTFTFTNATMTNLAGSLSQLTGGRKVVDRTGLSGRYDFTLSYAPERDGAGREGSKVSSADDSLPDSVFTALREQLGLNLEAQRSQVEFIVVDRLDRLIPN